MLTIIKSLKINTIRITSYDNKNEQFTKKKKSIKLKIMLI